MRLCVVKPVGPQDTVLAELGARKVLTGDAVAVGGAEGLGAPGVYKCLTSAPRDGEAALKEHVKTQVKPPPRGYRGCSGIRG